MPQTSQILIFLFIIFWIAHIIRRNFFWLYFWQKRGARFNRFFNGIKENKIILVSKSSIGAFFLILVSFFLSKVSFLFEGVVFGFYGLLAIYAFYLLGASIYEKDFKDYFWVLPRFSKRIIILFMLLIASESLFLSLVLYQGVKTSNYFIPLISSLIFEIIFPVFFFFIVFIFKTIAFFVRKILARKAKRKIQNQKDLIVIGISGSHGKTITKEFLFQLLSQEYKVLKTPKEIDSVDDIIYVVNNKLKKSHNVLIAEIPAYKRGEVKKICEIIKPKIGLITGISEQRISLFGNLKNIINTNYELINDLPNDGVGIFNITDKESQQLFQRASIKKYSYSCSEEKGDIFCKNILSEDNNMSFDIVNWKGEEKIKLSFLDKQNIENFLGAATCALLLGMTNLEIKKAAEKITLPDGLMLKKEGLNGAIVVDDTFSQSPNGFFAALDSIKNYDGKKIVICSSLSELGKASSSIHNNIGKKIGEICDLAIVVTPFFFKEIKLGAFSAGMDQKKIFFLRKPKKIFNVVRDYLKEGNVFLIEGDISDRIKKELITKTSEENVKDQEKNNFK